MTDQSHIERVVMQRVRLIRLLGLVISTTTLAFLTIVAALWGIGKEVWVARVFENMPQSGDLIALARFWFATFLYTRLIVQILSLLTLASFIFLARETARLIFSALVPARA